MRTSFRGEVIARWQEEGSPARTPREWIAAAEQVDDDFAVLGLDPAPRFRVERAARNRSYLANYVNGLKIPGSANQTSSGPNVRGAGGSEVENSADAPSLSGEPVEYTALVQEDWGNTPEFEQVRGIADALLAHVNTVDIRAAIAAAHGPRAPSSAVQATLLAFAQELGFKNEATGLFADYESRLRPDYFLQLGDTGILLEVERGKTITNNMDMLDFWKCHLCSAAHYLFLFVPRRLQHGDVGFIERPYAAVIRRLATFFQPRNYTNVRGVFTLVIEFRDVRPGGDLPGMNRPHAVNRVHQVADLPAHASDYAHLRIEQRV